MSQHKYVENKLKVVTGWAAADINGAAKNGDYVSLENYEKCLIVLQYTTDGAAHAITLTQATDNTGTGAKALAFDEYYVNASDTTSTTCTKTTATSNTFNTSGAALEQYQIEVSAIDLDQANNFTHIRVNAANPGAAAVAACTYIMLEPRYTDATPIDPTA